jgi:hypothetical protein
MIDMLLHDLMLIGMNYSTGLLEVLLEFAQS